MFKYSKLALNIFIILTSTIFGGIILLIFISDPLRIYKLPNPKNTTYIDNARLANLVMMRDHPFDSVIIGSSYSENTSAKEASDLFNAHFINLSLTGANPRENYVLLNYVLKNYPVKNVIYSLGDSYLYAQERGGHNLKLEDWAFLYDDNPFNDIRVYFNSKYFLKTLTFNTKSLKGEKLDMDRPYAWFGHECHYCRFGGFENWLKHKDNSQIAGCLNDILNVYKVNIPKIDEEYKIKLRKYFNDTMIQPMAQYPNVNFYIIIAPVSEIALSLESKNGVLEKRFYGENTLVELASNYPNIKVYGFNDDIKYAKIENYKDLAHFKKEYNSSFLKSIKENKNIINISNINDYHKAVKQIGLNVDYDYYKNLIQEALK